MSRLNIDDSLFSDPRFCTIIDKLGRVSAIGNWVIVAKLAQEYWARGGQLIPEKIYKLGNFPEIFLETEMVVIEKEGYYLRGSEESFAWLLAQRENGKKGGRPRKIKEIAKPIDNPTLTQKNPPTPTPTPTLVVVANKGDFSEKADQFISWWNLVAQEVRIVKVYKSPDNLYLIAKELSENPDMEYWKKALNGIYISEFHQGANKSGAKMNIGWFFKGRTAADLVDHYETNKHLFEGIIK